jgi:hypothetical protein
MLMVPSPSCDLIATNVKHTGHVTLLLTFIQPASS